MAVLFNYSRIGETVPDTGDSPYATPGKECGQFTTLLAQLLLAKASGLALKAKPIPRM